MTIDSPYQKLKGMLEALGVAIERIHVTGIHVTKVDVTKVDVSQLICAHREIQGCFQAQILSNRTDAVGTEMRYQVEIDKQLRLLGAELAMRQAARTPATAHKREQQLRDRIQILIGYCDAVESDRAS